MKPVDILEIYATYPRKIGRRTALLAVERAVRRLMAGTDTGQKMTYENAVFGLLQATATYARSPAGQRGQYTPHPSAWFNQSRYLDDPKEWNHAEESKDAAIARQNADILSRVAAKEGIAGEGSQIPLEGFDRGNRRIVGRDPKRLLGE